MVKELVAPRGGVIVDWTTVEKGPSRGPWRLDRSAKLIFASREVGISITEGDRLLVSLIARLSSAEETTHASGSSTRPNP